MGNKEKIIFELNYLCKQLLQEYTNDRAKKELYSTIATMLKDGAKFFECCDAEVGINVLIDLGYSKEEAKKTYIKLVSAE